MEYWQITHSFCEISLYCNQLESKLMLVLFGVPANRLIRDFFFATFVARHNASGLLYHQAMWKL